MIRFFEIPAPILGYRASAARAFDPRYRAFKVKVCLLARKAGVTFGAEDAEIRVLIYWNKRARIDGKNILAAVEDAIFAKDRRTAAGSWRRIEGTGEEKVLVEVETPGEGAPSNG